jgi:hypothetical protein
VKLHPDVTATLHLKVVVPVVEKPAEKASEPDAEEIERKPRRRVTTKA